MINYSTPEVALPPVSVAIAILYQNNKYLMQLRDNIPTIDSPGCWEMFGGHLESHETPEVGVKREIQEEIGYVITDVQKFGIKIHAKFTEHIFYAPLLVKLEDLVLNEGWDMALLTTDDIHQGSCYSSIAGETRPLGNIHHQIMLDFISKHT